MSLVHARNGEYQAPRQMPLPLPAQCVASDGAANAKHPARSSPPEPPCDHDRLLFTRDEEEGRYRRCCPYCNEPLTWRYFGPTVEDPKIERPYCRTHGPLRLWRVIRDGVWIEALVMREDPPYAERPVTLDVSWEEPAPYAFEGQELTLKKTVTRSVPAVRLMPRVLPRFLRAPLHVADVQPASPRWKNVPKQFHEPGPGREMEPSQPSLVPVQLRHLLRRSRRTLREAA